MDDFEATSADLAVAAKFLKDNEITCAPSADNAMGAMKEKLDAKRARKPTARTMGEAASFFEMDVDEILQRNGMDSPGRMQ